MQENIDINTAEITPALTITDDKQLCDIVYDIASKQLVINAAEAEMQAKVEAAKKAFADATEPLTSQIKMQFAAVETYAEAHKDRLFPVKAGKRKKTFAVLEHKLQYRCSEQVKAPSNAVMVIKAIIWDLECEAQKHNWEGYGTPDHEAAISALETLIRQPEPELNKDAVKSLCHAEARRILNENGIKLETLETFKLAFTFSPEQAAA